MLTKLKDFVLEGFKRTYNRRLIRLLLKNYVLIFPRWISNKNLSLYITIITIFVYWLHYEIFCVSPVCAYYTGPDFPSLLNKFKSVGKTYRPTIYLSSSTAQWLFLKLYCRFELFYKVSKYRLLKGTSLFLKVFYNLFVFLNNLLLKSFFLRRIFNSQPPISLREVVEGHNGSLVVMDWYLPKWVAPECPNCGLFKPEDPFHTTENTPNTLSKLNSDVELSKTISTLNPTKKRNNDYFQIYTIDSITPTENVKGFDNGSSVSSSELSSSSLSEDLNESSSYRFSHRSFKKVRQINLSDMNNGNLGKFDDQLPFFKIQDKYDTFNELTFESPNPKIIRGVLVIIGDMNVSYRICSTRSGCYCGIENYKYKENLCESCNENDRKDFEGFNPENPGFPVLRSLINDSLRLGFVCVNLHLNVNLGMASEAFPEPTTLRSFPVSLYSEVLIDLDCSLNKIIDRFPNSSLVAVGISYGSNILMEYLAMSSRGGTFDIHSDTESEVSNDFVPFSDKKLNVTKSENESLGTSGLQSSPSAMGSGHAGPGGGLPPDSLSEVEPSQLEINPRVDDLKNLDNLSDYTQTSKRSELHERKSNSSVSSFRFKNSSRIAPKNPHNENLLDDLKSMDPILRLSNLSRTYDDVLYEDHFALDLTKEEFNTETKLVFPDTQSQIVLNPDKISAAACINLNLKLSGHVLYNISKPKYRRWNIYKRFCFSTFRDQLVDLLTTVHCKRTNATLQKDCTNFNCCHYNKVISKFGTIKKLFYRIFFIKNKFKPNVQNFTPEQLITQLHREYRQSYRDLRSENRDFINYGSLLFDKFGVRTGSDFKVSVLMTLRHRFEREGPESKVKVRHITESPVYTCVNKKVKTNLRITKSIFSRRSNKLTSSAHRILDYKITKYINNIINSEYTRNITNIKENMEHIKVPTLLLYSLDNSLFTWRDIDIFEVIKNPNIVFYVSQSGGFSTFLSGIRPLTWFIGPVLEFLEEMSTKSKIF